MTITCCAAARIALADRVEIPEQAVAAFAADGALVDGVSGGVLGRRVPRPRRRFNP